MNARHFISRFTPSRTDPKDLEAILVQREDLLIDAVERVIESARSDNKHHLLFIGPRGSGKTHFFTLLFHRVDAVEDLKNTLRIAWLNEDETCARLLDLFMRIASALEKKYPAEFPADFYEDLASVSEAEATRRLSELLLARLGSRRLLVLVENLDALFESIRDSGQKALRALLQNHPVFCLVATAQALFDGVQKRDSPFFGSFQIEHLQPLTVVEAAELLAKIARLNGDDALAEFLATPSGCARVRALHHLSGGNHRIYIVLSELITRDSIDDLAQPFEEMLDELTPYYQERIRWLAPLQRRIVELLCRQQQPVAVKTIAKQLLSSHQTVASQLKVLRELRYVESHARGRESLYELSEPLMRLCVEIKDNQRKQPLRLLIDFLRVWYDEPQLEQLLQRLPAAALERVYVEEALATARSEQVPLLLRHLLEDAAHFDGVSPDGKQVRAELDAELPSRIVDVKLSSRILRVRALGEVRPADALKEVNALLETETPLPEQRAYLLAQRAVLYLKMNQESQALSDVAEVLNIAEASQAAIALALSARLACTIADHPNAALADLDRLIHLHGHRADRVASMLLRRGQLHRHLGSTEAALEDYTRAIDLAGARPKTVTTALFARASMRCRQGSWDEGLADLQHALTTAIDHRLDDRGDSAELIKTILRSGLGETIWASRIKPLLALYAQHDSLAALGGGLVRSLRTLRDAGLGDSGLDAWRSAWVTSGREAPALTIPLRIFSTGIEYLKSKDKGVLFDLLKEERSVLEAALELEHSMD